MALHRVYLEPDGPIYNVLIQAINHPIPFAEGFNRSSKNYEAAIDAIGDALKSLVARIVDFMVKHRRSIETHLFFSIVLAEGRNRWHWENIGCLHFAPKWKSISNELFLGL